MAERWFLKLDGIDGESTDVTHKAEIDVEAFSWGLSNPTVAGHGSGAAAGRPDFDDFHFVSRISKASPPLFTAAATGARIKWGLLSGTRTSDKGKSADFLKYKLSDVTVTSFHQSGAMDSPPVDQYSLSYSKMEIMYSPSTTSGKVAKAITAGYDVRTSKKI